MKKFSILFIILAFLSVQAFSQNTSLSTDEIDQELLDFVDDLNNEDFETEVNAINDIMQKLSETKLENQVVDYDSYFNKMTPTKTDDFKSLSLTDKLKVMKSNYNIEGELVTAFIRAEEKNTQAYINQMNLVSELMSHTSNVISIMTKIAESSNEYVGAAISNLTEAQTYVEDAKATNATLSTQIDLLNESLAYQEKKNKAANIAGNIAIPTIGIVGLIPCIVLMANGNETGYNLMMVDIGVTIGGVLIWDGGHFIFKWW